jgi:hypothetical protein
MYRKSANAAYLLTTHETLPLKISDTITITRFSLKHFLSHEEKYEPAKHTPSLHQRLN